MSRLSRRYRARFASLERLENRMLLDSALADLAQEWFANGPQAIVERDNVALVRLAESANPEVLSTYGGLVESTSARDLWRVSYDSREALSAALVGFGQSEQIVWAEAEGRESVSVIPNDTFFFVEYGLHNTGQQYASGLFGTNDADIDAPEAWDRRTSALSVVTANIDTGVNYTHPDLYKNIWINQGEIPASRKANLTDVDADGIITFWDLNDPINIGTNKISDFNGNARIDAGDLLEPLVIENGVDAGGGWANGVSDEVGGDSFTDDIIGWDFFNNDNNPMDDHGHGTHTSGTTAAIGNNGEGVAGVAWKAQIMVLKRFGSSGSSATSFGTLSVAYSVLKGAQVSNNSWGGSGFSQGLYDAVEDARDAGQIFIASAGNNASDIDITPAYPAAFDLANVVSVAATTANDGLASFSNYGDVTVDLGAPGDVIGSTYHDLNNPYVYMSGTSMAGPHVAGAAALVKAQRPSWGYAEIKAHLLSTVDPLASLAGKTVTGGRLNLQKALANVAPTDVALSNSSVAENQPVNTTVGTLSTTDPDLGDTFTYSLVSGTGDTDNASFNIASGVLRTSASFNFEVKSDGSGRPVL
jgi:subtilisin family serine protease